jgi:hypothetical protein
MPTVYQEVEVEVELDDFDTEDLIDELGRRGRGFDIAGQSPTELVNRIHQLRRNGGDYQRELDELIYVTIGRIA